MLKRRAPLFLAIIGMMSYHAKSRVSMDSGIPVQFELYAAYPVIDSIIWELFFGPVFPCPPEGFCLCGISTD